METSSLEVEEVRSRTSSASVVHRNGQNMSAGQTIAAVQSRSLFFFTVVYKPQLCLPVPRLYTTGTVDIPATASAAAVRATVPVPADVTATAPYAEALTAELLICGESECENQPCISEPGQTTVLSHPLLPAWSVVAKTCNRFYHTRYYHTPDCLEYGSKTRL